MRVVAILSCVLAVANAFPQDLPVVRPNHYLGNIGKEQHLLPESFFTAGQQVEAELKNLNIASVPQQQSQPRSLTLKTQQAPAADKAGLTGGPRSSNSAELDSYANIGGASGGIASALTNTHEYGEAVPPAFSTLDKDTYAYYHGHNN